MILLNRLLAAIAVISFLLAFFFRNNPSFPVREAEYAAAALALLSLLSLALSKLKKGKKS